MIALLKKTLFLAGICLISLYKSYSQPDAGGPSHFDDNYSQTGRQNGSYKGYTEKVNDSFVTTIFAAPTVKVARLTFADKALTTRHGEIKGFNERGEVMFVSSYNRNRLHGNWTSWYNKLVVCDSGKFENNLPDGVWKTWYPDGTLRSIRTFNAYKYHALIDEIRRNNPRLSFFYLTALVKKNKSLLDYYTNANYSYNTLAGNGVSRKSNHSLKQLGEINTDIETDHYLPPFTKGLLHGIYMNFYSNGLVKDSGYYKNGLRDGVWEERLENGNIRSTGFYQHGLKRNTWKFYNAEGKLLYYQHYDRHGKPDHGKEFPE